MVGKGSANKDFAPNKLTVWDNQKSDIIAERQFESSIFDLKVVGDWVAVGLTSQVFVFNFETKEGLNNDIKYFSGKPLPPAILFKRGVMDLHVNPTNREAIVVYPDEDKPNWIRVVRYDGIKIELIEVYKYNIISDI